MDRIDSKVIELMKNNISLEGLRKYLSENKKTLVKPLEKAKKVEQEKKTLVKPLEKAKKVDKVDSKKAPPANLFTRHPDINAVVPEKNRGFYKTKVGVTCAFFHDLYTNGHRFNTLLWYDMLTQSGYDVYFVTRKSTHVPKTNDFKVRRFEDNDMSQIKDLDVIFMCGTLDQSMIRYCRSVKKRYIYTIMGSTYHNDVRAVLNPEFRNPTAQFEVDEIWMSPHFEFCREYYKVKYRTDNIFVGPYFWRDDLMLQGKINNTVNKMFLRLRVAIVEPNIEQAKNCMIPIAICEKAKDHIDHCYVFNTFHLKSNTALQNYIGNLDLYKTKKISVEKRYRLGVILSRFANCVVSCVRDCELNYVHLECFYLGIPIVHNSKMLKEYGYYYPDYDVSKGAEQLKNILLHHNREEYIKRHKPILQKYSVYNSMYHAWIQDRLEKKSVTDCK